MKRRPLALILILCLLAALLPGQRALADDVCFISVNDQLLPEVLAVGAGSSVYVPYSIFANFRIYYQYYSYTDGATASLYTSDRQFYFDLVTGETTDGAGKTYAVSALSRNGQVYVPVAFVCGQFGLSWSYIHGSGYGDVCRIKDSSVILSDSLFIAAAESLMTPRYNAYLGIGQENDPDPPGGGGDDEGLPVYLSFAGLPSDKLLEALDERELKSTFFITAEEARSEPGLLRRLTGEGHGLGVLCSEEPAAQYRETAELIFEAAHVKTILIASAAPAFDEICREAAEENALVFWAMGVDGVRGGAGLSEAAELTVYLPLQPERADLRILCCEATDGCISAVINYILAGDYAYRRVCETENFAG